MDPLIELPEPAKARIKPKEAKAAEQFDLVRRACADDEAVARRTWGGYFDLHTDDLQDAIERARRPLTEASGICAQFVFLAHAVEYRSALPNPRELEPVLARLREAVITEYGEQVRPAIQRLEAEEFAKAWPEEQAGARGGAPVQVSPASDFKRVSPDDPRYTMPAQHIGTSAGAEVADRQQKVAHATENVPRPILSPPENMVPSSSRAIVMHPFGSAKVAHIRVPKMTYTFPADYPDAARRSFLARRLYAERMLEERKASIEDFQAAEALLLDFVLQLLLAFAEEAHTVGMQGDLTAADMESECLKFLRSYVLEAGLMDSPFGVLPRGDTQIPDSFQARIESSDQWGKYRELLQNVADAQAHELFIWSETNVEPADLQEVADVETVDLANSSAIVADEAADDQSNTSTGQSGSTDLAHREGGVVRKVSEAVPEGRNYMAPKTIERPRVRRKDEQLEATRQLVKQMKAEGSTHQEICKRLGDHPRPIHAVWRNLPWPVAYLQHTSSVKKWLSAASK